MMKKALLALVSSAALMLPSLASLPPYAGGIRPISEEKFAATGFFRLEAKDDGFWRVIDPDGREIVPLGVNCVMYEGWKSRGPRRRYLEWNKAHYPSRKEWEEETLSRLKAWGFNALSSGNTNLYHRGLMHTRILRLGSRLCHASMAKEFWICPHLGRPCTAFPNVFHPRFRTWCENEAKLHCRKSKLDRWLFGYYIDNELAWWGRGKNRAGLGLVDEVLKLEATHSAFAALKDFAGKRGCKDLQQITDEIKLAFLRLIAERYFSETTAAIRKADGNHLILGSRFAGFFGAHECVWEIGGKYCDVMAANLYPWADLEQNEVRVNSSASSLSIVDMFKERFAIAKKPFLVTEWSFPALDSGLPCTRGGGQRFATQELRTQASELFVRTLLNTPSVIGYDYFMWVDEPPEGVSDALPEDTNYGLVNEQGRPYPLTEMFARLQNNVAQVRLEGLPAKRTVRAMAGKDARSALQAIDDILKRKPADTNNFVLPPFKVGPGPVMKRIACADGRELGDFSMMIAYKRCDKLNWLNASRITGAAQQSPDEWRVVCEGALNDSVKFEIKLDLKLFAEKGCFVANVVSVKNIGSAEFDLQAVYCCVRSPFAAETPEVIKIVPNMWKRPKATRWQAKDGRWIGARSEALMAADFNYRFNVARNRQYPDAMFKPFNRTTLKPQETFTPQGAMWCIIEGGVEAGRKFSLRPPAMKPLAAGSIRAEGHLLAALERQRAGLTDHAEELYEDIGKSDWLTNLGKGGEFAWERGPYYARGLVALALTLGDEKLKAKARRWVDAVISSQKPNGDFGPRARNWWANMLPQSYLRTWAEATGDERIVPFLERYYRYQMKELEVFSLSAESCWASARVGDQIETVLWLYEKTGNDEWIDFAGRLASQGADWTGYYHTGGSPGMKNGYRCHIVNFMQGLKLPALKWRLGGSQKDRRAYSAAFAPGGWVMRTCSRPDAMLNGSEPLTDRSASGATELCAIAERIVSARSLLSIFGDTSVADDLEDVAYNALPATVLPDGKGIRYYLMLNQPVCIDKNMMFANNGGPGQITGAICPGPHSGFGCCRSNWHIARPEFVSLMWMKKENGIASLLHGPGRVTTSLGGGIVTLCEETDYPYSGRITIRIVEGGGMFPIFVRVPRWAKCDDAGGFRKFERVWKAGDKIEINFPMAIELSFWDRNALCVRRGPLIYALKQEALWRKIEKYTIPYEKKQIVDFGGEFPRWEILSKTPWNYALVLDKNGKLKDARVVDGAQGTEIRLRARRTNAAGWGHLRMDAPARAIDPPHSPLAADVCGEDVEISLVPLGKTQIRVTLFPWLEE